MKMMLPSTKKLRMISRMNTAKAKMELARRRLRLYFFKVRLETIVRFLTGALLKLALIKQVT